MPEKDHNVVGMEARQLWERGYEQLEKKQWDYAMELLCMAVEKDPGFFECRMALRAAQVKKYENASSLAKIAGTAANAHNMAQAKVALVRKNYFGALSHAEKVLCADPESSVAHRVIVDASSALDLPQTMISSLQMLKKVNPENKDLTKELGTALEMLGDWDQAEQVMGQLAAVNPDDPVLQQAYKDTAAKATIFRGQYEKMMTEPGAGEEGLGDNAEAETLSADEALDEKIYHMEERLQGESDNYKLGVDIAKLYVQRRDFERAFEYYDWVLDNNQVSDSAIDRAVADAYQAQYDNDIEAFPEGSPEREGLVRERDGVLLENCQERAERYPTMLEFRFELGERLLRMDQVNEAIQAFQKAQNSPKHKLDSLNYLGQCFMKRGMHDMALSQFEKALGEKKVMDQQRKELVYNLACVYEEQGRREEAARYFKEIYEVDINFLDVADKVESGYSSGA
mgnify:FL=1